MFCGVFGQRGKVSPLKPCFLNISPQMEMATAELDPAKETRCEPLASRRCAPDFRPSRGGRAGGLEEVAQGLVVVDVGK